MMRFLFLTLFLLCLSSPSYADRIFTEIGGSYDSDEASTLNIYAGYRHTLEGLRKTEIEVAIGQRSYAEPGERERFNAGRLHFHRSPSRNSHLTLRCEFLDGDDWSPILPAAIFTTLPTDKWYLELSAEREPVDSVSAVRNHIDVDSYVASADYRINDRLTVVGAYIFQSFNDNNRKNGGIVRLIYSPAQLPGFNVQLKGRLLNADQDSGHYFSPEQLTETFLLFGYATPFADDNWVIKLLVGPGLQRIEPFSDKSRDKTGYHGEVSLRGWFNDQVELISRLGCTSSNDTQDAYDYCFGNMHLGYIW